MSSRYRSFLFLLSFLLAACGGGKSDEQIEKEAKESAEKAAQESLNKLNRDSGTDDPKKDTSEADSTMKE